MMNFILNNISWVWVAVLVVSILIEIFTMSLTTVWCAISALPMIFISRTSLPVKWQILLFVILCAVLIIFTRPFAVKKLKIGKNKTNVDSLLGQEVLVVKKISEFQKGEVKVRGGIIWSASSESSKEIPSGEHCVVEKIEGNTLVVRKI